MGRIQKYDKGVCYYEIFIRHFTDEEGGYAPADGSPWVKEGEYAQAQLGRYGVVRNNWYTVTIKLDQRTGRTDNPRRSGGTRRYRNSLYQLQYRNLCMGEKKP